MVEYCMIFRWMLSQIQRRLVWKRLHFLEAVLASLNRKFDFINSWSLAIAA